ncbi:hypothetical protein ACO0LV_13055 [Pseudactinotalea sp. Z1739]|uniref:hypothetical protein n=1 Tax=Pseudactinotalea sp. Z1739 TaxID=3413028 RepID=UPI003C7A4FDD
MVAFTTAPEGTPEAVYVANSDPAVASVVDVRTGERQFSQELDGVVASWGSQAAPNGDVYIGSQRNGTLYRYVPGSETIEAVGRAIESETHHWGLDIGEDGYVAGGTYPNGKVFGYDPATGEFTDYGRLVDGVDYVRDVAVGETHIYAGTSPSAHLVEIDRETGDVLEIELPEAYQGEAEVYNVSYQGGLVFARVTPVGVTLVYDPHDDWALLDEISESTAFQVSPPDDDGVVYFDGTGAVIAYDTAAREYERREGVSFSNRGTEWLELGTEEFPGRTLVSSHFGGEMYLYDPVTGTNTQVSADVAGAPVELRSLGTGPDGDVYAGGYLSPPGMAHVDADNGQTQLLPGISQVEGMGVHGDDLVLGVYPNAGMYAYDTIASWDAPGNPSGPTRIGEQQDRPVAITSIDEARVAIGTVPVSGELGGALSLWDVEADRVDTHRNVVEDQSVIALTERDGLIYGGTSIHGGLGIDPTAEDGELFIFDPETQEVVHAEVPVPGQQYVAGLAFDDEGLLWGLTAGWLFTYDVEEREVLRVEEIMDVGQPGAYWVGRDLVWSDERLFGVTGGALFEIDPVDWNITVLADGSVQNLAVDRNGSLYYTRGANLFRFDLAEGPSDPVCDETISGTHRGPLQVTDGTTCIIDAEVSGPTTVFAGTSLVMADSTISGPVRGSGAVDVQIRDNEISGPVQITDSIGQVRVQGNHISGRLACSGNAETPTGGDNTVRGTATGQCAGLAD